MPTENAQETENVSKITKTYGNEVLKENRSWVKKSEYLVSIIVNLILYFVFKHLLTWKFPYLTDDFALVLPILSLSIVANIIGNSLLLIYDGKGFRELVKMVLNCFSIYFMYKFFVVYPLDLSSIGPGQEWIEMMVKAGLLLGIFGTFIATIVEFAKMFKDD